MDNAWVSTGSANLDPHSAVHNDELNISGRYPPFDKLIGRVVLLFKNLL